MPEFLSEDDLKRFVTSSNKIEGVSTVESDPLYFGQHLAAAQSAVESVTLLSLRGLHRQIMDNLLEDGQVAGQYRTVSAYIGSKPMPSPAAVPMLMFALGHRLRAVVINAQCGGFSDEIIEKFLFMLHDEALCIHPFADGNGRTFRLALNHWRRLCGLPWIDFSTMVWEKHLARLRQYEKDTFRLLYHWSYDK